MTCIIAQCLCLGLMFISAGVALHVACDGIVKEDCNGKKETKTNR